MRIHLYVLNTFNLIEAFKYVALYCLLGKSRFDCPTIAAVVNDRTQNKNPTLVEVWLNNIAKNPFNSFNDTRFILMGYFSM